VRIAHFTPLTRLRRQHQTDADSRIKAARRGEGRRGLVGEEFRQRQQHADVLPLAMSPSKMEVLVERRDMSRHSGLQALFVVDNGPFTVGESECGLTAPFGRAPHASS